MTLIYFWCYHLLIISVTEGRSSMINVGVEMWVWGHFTLLKPSRVNSLDQHSQLEQLNKVDETLRPYEGTNTVRNWEVKCLESVRIQKCDPRIWGCFCPEKSSNLWKWWLEKIKKLNKSPNRFLRLKGQNWELES